MTTAELDERVRRGWREARDAAGWFIAGIVAVLIAHHPVTSRQALAVSLIGAVVSFSILAPPLLCMVLRRQWLRAQLRLAEQQRELDALGEGPES